MIPKVIHYCWFGGNQIPDEYKKYMESWSKYCPDFEIKRWDESNFDINSNVYCKEAYEAKQWAFVSDYARLKIIHDLGGVYLDTDVELIRNIEPLIQSGVGFIGFQNPVEVATGLGFAAAKENPCIKSMLSIYENKKFILKSGDLNKIPCPASNTVGLQKCGLRIGKKYSKEIQKLQGLNVYPVDFFCPLNADTSKLTVTENTYSIHQYTGSWLKEGNKRIQKLKKYIPNVLLNLRVIRISYRDIAKISKEINKEINKEIKK
ncbi:glycosyltransferase family 32 protein [Streptococcus suis]|uniref:glycosyltransferase family 32 protein n=1 Tax=Streptococcus suis TaxID=1307 RepID=UPI001EE78A33|nr:glycosyltransferase [Streptococcus suis]MBS8055617.1 glycosyl transferase [Streptococcus suis]